MSIALPGVFTGINTDGIVAQMMAISSRRLYRLQDQKGEVEDKIDAVSDLEGRLGALKAAVDNLRDVSSLKAVTAGTSDQAILGLSATGAANEGAHEIVINRLATGEREVHEGIADQEAELDPAGGSFVYTYDGVTRTILTTADTTLEELSDLINNDADNPGVAASILEYEVDVDHVYHLVLSGRDSGGDYGVTIEAGTTLAGFAPGTFTETLTAQDSQIKIDGYPAGAGDWIERSSNTITDVVDGVTLRLNDEGTANVTIRRDVSELKNDLSNLAAIYTGIVMTINKYTGYDQDTREGGLLQGDSVINNIISPLRGGLSGPMGGFDADEDPFTILGEIGLEFNRDGELVFNDSTIEGAPTFDSAVEDDYLGVLALIGADRTGASDSDYIQFLGASSGTEAGIYEVEVDFDTDTSEITAARYRLTGAATWEDMDVNVATGVVTSESEADNYLQLKAIWDGITEEGGGRTQTAEVRVQQGFAGAIYEAVEAMLDPLEGTVTMTKDIYEDRIDNNINGLDRQIEREQERLEDEEERLLARFARLEATLAMLDSQRASFSAMLGSLSQISGSASDE